MCWDKCSIVRKHQKWEQLDPSDNRKMHLKAEVFKKKQARLLNLDILHGKNQDLRGVITLGEKFSKVQKTYQNKNTWETLIVDSFHFTIAQ